MKTRQSPFGSDVGLPSIFSRCRGLVRISQPRLDPPGASSVSGIPATERPNLSQGSGTWETRQYVPAPATPSPGFLQANQAILFPRNHTALVQVRYEHDRVVCCKSLGVSGCFAVVSRR